MKYCYLCHKILNPQNESKEHILLNSIGGRLKSKKLLCKFCNSKFGHVADSELANQLAFLSSFLQIKREKGNNPKINGAKNKDGVEYNILDGNKPVLAKPKFEQINENGEIKYSITARNEKESLKILKSLKKKHPELDLDHAIQNMQFKEEYLDQPLIHNITIGGDLAFKSIVKTAVNYYLHTQNEVEYIEHLFPYLRSELELKIANHFYPKKVIYKKEPNEIIHLIHIYGNKHSQQLYCYIEFFSTYSFLVLLSDKYQGNNISTTYCYDLLKNEELSKSVNLKSVNLSEINNLTTKDIETIAQKLNRVLDITNKIQVDREINNITKKVIEKVFEKHKQEPILTEQMINEIANEIANEYVRFAFRGQK